MAPAPSRAALKSGLTTHVELGTSFSNSIPKELLAFLNMERAHMGRPTLVGGLIGSLAVGVGKHTNPFRLKGQTTA